MSFVILLAWNQPRLENQSDSEIKHFGQSDKRILKDDFNLAVILGEEEESNRELTRYEFVPYVSESISDCYLSQEEQENAE